MPCQSCRIFEVQRESERWYVDGKGRSGKRRFIQKVLDTLVNCHTLLGARLNRIWPVIECLVINARSQILELHWFPGVMLGGEDSHSSVISLPCYRHRLLRLRYHRDAEATMLERLTRSQRPICCVQWNTNHRLHSAQSLGSTFKWEWEHTRYAKEREIHSCETAVVYIMRHPPPP